MPDSPSVKDLSEEFENIRDIVSSTLLPTTSCSDLRDQGSSRITTQNEADRRLLNWERWIRIRKRDHKNLAKAFDRSRAQMLINSAEFYRAQREEKLVMDYTNILTPPDKQRGSPAFWKLPTQLKAKGCSPPIFASLTKEDRCIIPEIEYVGTPDAMLEMKDIVPLADCKKRGKIKGKYLEQRKKDLESKIKLIQPHKPDISRLMVVGKPIFDSVIEKESSHSTIAAPPLIEVSCAEEPCFCKSCQNECIETLIGIRINGRFLHPFRETENTLKFHLSFEHNLLKDSKTKETLTLENVGNVALKYFWKQDSLMRTHRTNFFFNKTVGVLLPGKKVEIPIWFTATEPGSHFEIWELKFSPHVTKPSVRVELHLRACAEFGDMQAVCLDISNQINENVRNRVISDALNDLISGVTVERRFSPREVEVDLKQIFEALNMTTENQVMTTYLYNKEVVDELKEFYYKIRTPADPEEWNLVVSDLKKTLIRNFPPNKDTLYKDLNSVISKLVSLSCTPNEDKEKFREVYNILVTTFDKIDDILTDLREDLCLDTITYYPELHRKYTSETAIEDVPERELTCFPNAVYDSPAKKQKHRAGTPAANILQGAETLEDKLKRYDEYLAQREMPTASVPSVKEIKGKKTSDHSSGAQTTAKRSEDNASSKITKKKQKAYKEDEVDHLNLESTNVSVQNLIDDAEPLDIKGGHRKHSMYDELAYITFYHWLGNAADEIEATLGSKEQILKMTSSEIKRMVTCQKSILDRIETNDDSESVQNLMRSYKGIAFPPITAEEVFYAKKSEDMDNHSMSIQTSFPVLTSEELKTLPAEELEYHDKAKFGPKKVNKEVQKDYEDGDEQLDLEALIEIEDKVIDNTADIEESEHNINMAEGDQEEYYYFSDEDDRDIERYMSILKPEEYDHSKRRSRSRSATHLRYMDESDFTEMPTKAEPDVREQNKRTVIRLSIAETDADLVTFLHYAKQVKDHLPIEKPEEDISRVFPAEKE